MGEIVKSEFLKKNLDFEFAAKDIFVETFFYKNTKNAHWFFVLFFSGLLFMFIGLKIFDDYLFPILVLCLLIIVPVYSLLSKKGWFSFAALDDRKLVIDPKGIQVGELYYKFEDMQQLDVFFHSFHNLIFIYKSNSSRIDRGYIIEEGNKNELTFKYGSQKYYFKFILRNLEAYMALRTIIQFWITSNDDFTAKERYPIAVIIQYNTK